MYLYHLDVIIQSTKRTRRWTKTARSARMAIRRTLRRVVALGRRRSSKRIQHRTPLRMGLCSNGSGSKVVASTGSHASRVEEPSTRGQNHTPHYRCIPLVSDRVPSYFVYVCIRLVLLCCFAFGVLRRESLPRDRPVLVGGFDEQCQAGSNSAQVEHRAYPRPCFCKVSYPLSTGPV